MTEATRTVDLYSSGVFLEIDGIQVGKIDLPSGYVPYHFMPLIDKHTVISGDKLVNGMIVLVEAKHRENPESLEPEYRVRNPNFRPSGYDRRRVQETARWALVTDFHQQGQIITFTAIYADGTMAERGGYNQSIRWTLLREFTFEGVPHAGACAICGEPHDEEAARTVADNDADQMFYDVMDSGANLIGALLFPEATTKAERITRVKETLKSFDLDDFFEGFMEGFDDLFGGVTNEEPTAEAKDDFVKQPGTSIVDDFDQSTFGSEEERIEAEEAAAAARQRILDDEALAALREKLRGPSVAQAALRTHIAAGGER